MSDKKHGRFSFLVKEAVDKYRMLDCSSVLVGFSGGEDSCALLSLLDDIKDEYGFRLYACHVNHGIREDEADRDERFCVNFCERRGIKLFVKKINVPTLCIERGLGTEECARYERYRIFNEICSQNSIESIATAHHADDNAETVLFNLLRGSGLNGARGIPPVRENIIRPLIFCSRVDIIEYVRENGISFVVDSTNTDTDYSRNRLRAKVIPELKSVNDAAVYNISRFSESARCDSDFIEEYAHKLMTDEISVLVSLHKAVLSRIIRLLYGRAGGGFLESKHVDDIMRMVYSVDNVSAVSLPGKITCRKERGRLVFSKETETDEFCFALKLGENKADGFDFLIVAAYENLPENVLEDYMNIYKKSIHVTIASDKINKVIVRSRSPGDSYRTGGITKKVKKMLQDDKMTYAQKRSTPVFCDESGPFWLPGHKMRDGMFTEASGGLNIYYFRGE